MTYLHKQQPFYAQIHRETPNFYLDPHGRHRLLCPSDARLIGVTLSIGGEEFVSYNGPESQVIPALLEGFVSSLAKIAFAAGLPSTGLVAHDPKVVSKLEDELRAARTELASTKARNASLESQLQLTYDRVSSTLNGIAVKLRQTGVIEDRCYTLEDIAGAIDPSRLSSTFETVNKNQAERIGDLQREVIRLKQGAEDLTRVCAKRGDVIEAIRTRLYALGLIGNTAMVDADVAGAICINSGSVISSLQREVNELHNEVKKLEVANRNTARERNEMVANMHQLLNSREDRIRQIEAANKDLAETVRANQGTIYQLQKENHEAASRIAGFEEHTVRLSDLTDQCTRLKQKLEDAWSQAGHHQRALNEYRKTHPVHTGPIGAPAKSFAQKHPTRSADGYTQLVDEWRQTDSNGWHCLTQLVRDVAPNRTYNPDLESK